MGGVHRKPSLMSYRLGEYSTNVRNMTPEQRQQEIERLQKEAEELRRQDAMNTAMRRTTTAQGDTTIDTVQNRNFFAIGAQKYVKVETPVEKLQRGFNDKCQLWKKTFQNYQAKLQAKGRQSTHENIDEQIQKMKNRYAGAEKEWEWAQANAMVDAKIHALEACIGELDAPTVNTRGKRPKMSFNTYG